MAGCMLSCQLRLHASVWPNWAPGNMAHSHWLVAWLGHWLGGWLGDWLVGWLGSWAIGWLDGCKPIEDGWGRCDRTARCCLLCPVVQPFE